MVGNLVVEIAIYNFDLFHTTLMWRLIVSGKVFEGGPCTPFDPAPPGLKVQEGQGEEAVSISVFIEQV